MSDPSKAAAPSPRVLLVEDSAINRELLLRRLVRRGFTVETAADGREGYELALSSSPDVVLMDMSLPEMDGWEATARLRQAGFVAPIIGLTAHALSEDRKRALQAGCDEFITKPVDFDLLVSSIHRLATIASPSPTPAPTTVEPSRVIDSPPASVQTVSAQTIEMAVAAVLAEHAHALNNARSALIAAIDVGDAPELAIPLARDADDALGELARAWSRKAEALHVTRVSSCSVADVGARLASAVGGRLGEMPAGSVRVDLEAMVSAVSALCLEPCSVTRVTAEVRACGVLEKVDIRVGPVAHAMDPSTSAVSELLKRMQVDASISGEPATITLSIVRSQEAHR